MKVKKIVLAKFCFIISILFLGIFFKKDYSFSNLSIEIKTNGFRQYIDATDVFRDCDLLEDYNTIKKIDINTTLLEDYISQLDYVSNAEVYLSDSNLTVLVEQNNPFLRLGGSYYLNRDGEKMLVSSKNFADVLFFSGQIKDENFDEICTITNYIYQDCFMQSLVKGVHYDKDVGYILFPRLLDLQIIFGDTLEIQEKFNKIKTFYQRISKSPKIFDNEGNLLIKTVNIKYSNQIICTKNN